MDSHITMLPPSIEARRTEIEADHNRGIPRNEWMSLEAILRQALCDESPRAVAEVYDITESELRVWLRSINAPHLRMRIKVSPQLYRYRLKIGMRDAATRPPMTPHKRAKIAAYARWNRPK